MKRTVFHILEGDSRSRAEQARVIFALGHHAEVYGDIEELLERAPLSGVILAGDSHAGTDARDLLLALADRGISVPVVMTATRIALERVVDAIRAGALDYLMLPLEFETFARRLRSIAAEAELYAERCRKEIDARHTIARLSQRERQVLALLSAGNLNKDIGEQLGISVRTAEIHRSNMMTKLGAHHPADAVKAWLAAGLDRSNLRHRLAVDQGAASHAGEVLEEADYQSRSVARR